MQHRQLIREASSGAKLGKLAATSAVRGAAEAVASDVPIPHAGGDATPYVGEEVDAALDGGSVAGEPLDGAGLGCAPGEAPCVPTELVVCQFER